MDKLKFSKNYSELFGILGERYRLAWEKNLLKINWQNDFLLPFIERKDENGYIGLGKTMEALSLIAAQTQNPLLLDLRRKVVKTLLETQEPDGYTGIMKQGKRIVQPWDVHEHGYLIMALSADWEYFQEKDSLAAAENIAKMLIKYFDETGIPEYGFALHLVLTGLDMAFLKLFRLTGNTSYLNFCKDRLNLEKWDLKIVEGRFKPYDGHVYAYLARALAQMEFFRLTGEKGIPKTVKRALNYLFKEHALLVTGTCGIKECWHSNQTGSGDIGETCATVYLIFLLAYLLADSNYGYFGDCMERSLYNAFFAAQSPDGRHIRYYTPFEGERKYWPLDTYCCPGNFRRGIAYLPEMVAFRNNSGILINLYSKSRIYTRTPQNDNLIIEQNTDYPDSEMVEFEMRLSNPSPFSFQMRIPTWCKDPAVTVNNKECKTVFSKGLLSINRIWKSGDIVSLSLPVTWRWLKGFGKQKDKVALLRGPRLFCFNPGLNPSIKTEHIKSLVMIQNSLHGFMPDRKIRPGGVKVNCMARPSSQKSGSKEIKIVLTDFTDPGGTATYFNIDNYSVAKEDELFSEYPKNLFEDM
jgi:uncharacterized protein